LYKSIWIKMKGITNLNPFRKILIPNLNTLMNLIKGNF
jgi:hypothetical protein